VGTPHGQPAAQGGARRRASSPIAACKWGSIETLKGAELAHHARVRARCRKN
jgi:hypothetical protein